MVELLAVITIVGILAAILTLVIGRARASAKRSECLQNVRQLGIASLLYSQDNKGVLPLGDANAAKDNYWHHKIHPYLFSNDTGFSGYNLKKVYVCPDDEAQEGGDDGNDALSYGFNTNLKNMRVNQIAKPVAMIGDASGSIGINASTTTTTLAYRHNNAAMIFYADGHAGPLEQSAYTSFQALRKAVFLPD